MEHCPKPLNLFLHSHNIVLINNTPSSLKLFPEHMRNIIQRHPFPEGYFRREAITPAGVITFY